MLNFAANKSDHIDEIAQGQLKVINFLFAQNCSTPAEENLNTSTDPFNYRTAITQNKFCTANSC